VCASRIGDLAHRVRHRPVSQNARREAGTSVSPNAGFEPANDGSRTAFKSLFGDEDGRRAADYEGTT
jgi:hypothetical protein